MAKQQLYSRVPAKVSMFNRADSFDTFACSEELDKEFIDKNLSAVCENKPTPEEAALLRTQDLQPVYHQFCCRSGELVQSCTSYIRLDYTGERSAYLVHNLVYDDAERAQILDTTDHDPLNPALFETDIAKFDITSPDATPNREYPHLAYRAVEAENTRWIAETYDANMLRRFIYAMLSTVCGKLKSVFFVLGDGDPSLRALRFLNSIMQIVPYHLRPDLSFATRVSDSARFGNIKLKAVPPSVTNIPPSRGATLDFKTKLTVGVRDEDVNTQLAVVEFFYGLLLNDAVRREFLLCCQRAVANVPTLGAPTFKALGDLVFVFRSTSGMFDERVILPNDDKLLEFFTIYEKARGALSDEYRINAAKSLRRYPAGHTEIPKPLFAKICKIYPTEIEATKRVIMGVVLELIHTDIMRDKLFTFIKNNYAGEDAETKATICRDLARVYYGGFLQPQILAFFGTIFADADPESRAFIAGKVLLTVRTKAISAAVLAFLAQQYANFDEDSKTATYKTVYENLPDGDALAGDLLGLVEGLWDAEPPQRREEFVAKLLKLLEAEQHRTAHPLLRLVAQRGGRIGACVDQHMVTEWYGRKCFAEYVAYLTAGRTQTARVQWLVDLWQANPAISPDATRELTVAVVAAQEANPVRTDLFVLLGLEQQILQLGDEGSEALAAFADMYATQVLQPLVAGALYDAFRHTERVGAVAEAVEYVGNHPALADGRYEVLLAYMDLKVALPAGQTAEACAALAKVPRDKALRTQMAAMLEGDLRAEQCDSLTARVVLAYLRTGAMGWNDLYIAQQEAAAECVNPKLNAKKAQWFKQTYALQAVLKLANELYAAAPEGLQADIVAENGGLKDMLGAFLSTWDKKGHKELLAQLHTLPPKQNPFVTRCLDILAQLRPAKKGKFGK